MRNFTTWLIVFFGFMFWGFRVAGAFAAGTGMDFYDKTNGLGNRNTSIVYKFYVHLFYNKKKNFSSNNLSCNTWILLWSIFISKY